MTLHCLRLLRSKSNVNYCLQYHDWIETCPKLCAYMKRAQAGTVENAVQEHYNIECLYLTRLIEESSGKISFYCKLMALNHPHCDACQFTSYPMESILFKI